VGARPVTEAAPSAAPPTASAGRARRARAWLFAGDRRVWRAAAIVGLPLALVIVVWCLVPRAYYTGTDSVEDYTYVAQTPPGVPLCVPGLQLPAGTAGIRLRLISRTQERPVLHLALAVGGGTIQSSLPPTHVGPDRISTAVFPIPLTAAHPASRAASLCLTAADLVNWGGTPALQGGPPATEGGQPIQGHIAMWFQPRPGAKRSYLAEAGAIFRRAALFRPGVVGAWTYALLLFVVLPGLALLALRTLAVAVAGDTRRLGRSVFAIAAVNIACWALITPAFQGPDEPDHFAYTQSLVERGSAPSRDPGMGSTRWSGAETRALDAVKLIGNHQVGDSRAPGLAADEATYRAALSALPHRRDDGGGNETAATHGPLYYLALAPAYAATRGGSVFSQLTAMRLLSGLIAALTALFTFLLARELAPRRPWLGVLAALLVSFEPMYAFISGIVNNDAGVNAGAAALELLLLRLLRRGVTVPWGVGTGAVLILLPIVKGTALALYPAAAAVLVLTLWRHRTRRDLVGLAALVLTAVIVQEASVHLAGALHRSAGNSPGVGASVSASSAALHDVRGYLSYLYEALVPRQLWFTTPHFQGVANPDFVIFVERGFGAFGWYDLFWAPWVYSVILVVMLATPLLALAAAVREWPWVRAHWAECAAIVLFPVCVVAGFEAAFYTPTSRQAIAEFGRYAFPAIGPLALLVVGALHAFGRRAVVYAGAGLATAMIALSFAGQLLTLTGFYS
jgi:hypothetical protein